jgi:hypothetical protein
MASHILIAALWACARLGQSRLALGQVDIGLVKPPVHRQGR